MSGTEVKSSLSLPTRLVFCAFGLAFCGASFMAAIHPARLKVEERDARHKVAKQTITEVSRNELALLTSGIGAVLLVFGLNGSRLSKLSVGSVTAEARPPEVLAAEKTARQMPQIIETQPPVDPPESETQPVAPLSGHAIFNNSAMSVYSKDAVPAKVLQDALDYWPESLSKPADLTAFEFALRQAGKGNLPWILKFKNLYPVRISYGGRGKPEPTVQLHQ